jgi:Organic Anion Transporter Polypeptide (OATP) family
MFSNCSCVSGGGPVIDGICPVDCSQAFMLFIIIQCIQRFVGATGKAGNTLIHFRCVNPEDKSVAIGFSEFLLSGCAYIPGPIVFGYLIGRNAICDLKKLFWLLFYRHGLYCLGPHVWNNGKLLVVRRGETEIPC